MSAATSRRILMQCRAFYLADIAFRVTLNADNAPPRRRSIHQAGDHMLPAAATTELVRAKTERGRFQPSRLAISPDFDEGRIDDARDAAASKLDCEMPR